MLQSTARIDKIRSLDILLKSLVIGETSGIMLAMPPKKMPATKKKTIQRPPIVEQVIEMEDPPETGSSAGETVTFKRSYLYGLLTVVAFGAGIFVGYMLWEYQPKPKPVIYEIETAGFPSLGPADAPVVIVEFSDYECPFCVRWYAETYRPLLAAYPGKIRLVFRNFPLSFHENAVASAEAALCAGDQDAYWKYHDALFDHYLALYQADQDRLLDQYLSDQAG